ncbi:N-glycosidase [Pseudocercospora fuligena]|uniref:N-glycosidase n=1 Tax=Pseudocercospora fuligena TaxID=685502 RepID=A0A8H6VMH3_9PEZI|nr:N-glycosidase [Pseudocercospora fuligena]
MKTKGNEARLASKKKKEQAQSSAVTLEAGPSTGWRDPQGTIYFWREFERHYGFLCQWAPSPFEVDGKLYYTAEHWMMAGKARLFRDQPMMVKILQSTHPGKAKALGKQVRGFSEKIWLQHCDEVVEEGNMHKFGSNEGLRRKLLATGNRELVEASPRDRVWGVGFDAAHAETNRSQWGQNRLALVLMRVRERLREEDRKKETGDVAEVVEEEKAEESRADTDQHNHV